MAETVLESLCTPWKPDEKEAAEEEVEQRPGTHVYDMLDPNGQLIGYVLVNEKLQLEDSEGRIVLRGTRHTVRDFSNHRERIVLDDASVWRVNKFQTFTCFLWTPNWTQVYLHESRLTNSSDGEFVEVTPEPPKK